MIRTRFAVSAILMLSTAAVAANPPLPTDQDLQQLFDAKEYRACLQQTARVLQLKGEPAKPYDPYVLHMRRGECLLNLNDGTTALAAFTSALNAADDGMKAEKARANIVMIKGSRNLNYTPAGGGATINIVKIDDRRRAMTLLCNELLKVSATEYRAAMAAPALGPVINFFAKAQELHALEMVGTGADTLTQPMLLDMGERARTLIVQELQSIAGRINGIEARANQLLASGTTVTQVNGYSVWVADTRMGLTPEDRDDLRNTMNYLNQVVGVTQEGKRAAQSFGRDGQVWDPLIADGEAVMRHAASVLNAE